jgi:hypothetical protein
MTPPEAIATFRRTLALFVIVQLDEADIPISTYRQGLTAHVVDQVYAVVAERCPHLSGLRIADLSRDLVTAKQELLALRAPVALDQH